MTTAKKTSFRLSAQIRYGDNIAFARSMDQQDTLATYRSEFFIPKAKNGDECVYLCGNSLGLQPIKARQYIEQELSDWASLGVEGHWNARHPWLPYHENLTGMAARLVGARPVEVVIMNTLTTNLHLMMVSFYRPTQKRFKIIVEANAFPSDQYAVASQARFHGFDPQKAIIELKPREGESTIATEDIVETINEHGKEIALVMLGNVNYLTGQAFHVQEIAKAAHAKGANFGLNLAHGAGNLFLKLHDWDVDFAVWCGYKYLNAGPGALAGCFVHEKHSRKFDLPRFAGWWGHNKETRFEMPAQFDALPGAEGWQLSNPPIFQLAALRASMELFDQATIPALWQKSKLLTGYLEFLLDKLPEGFVTIITPRNPDERGCQLSLKISGDGKELVKQLSEAGVICDFREPDIMRVAPTPLYNTFEDVYKFAKVLDQFAQRWVTVG